MLRKTGQQGSRKGNGYSWIFASTLFIKKYGVKGCIEPRDLRRISVDQRWRCLSHATERLSSFFKRNGKKRFEKRRPSALKLIQHMNSAQQFGRKRRSHYQSRAKEKRRGSSLKLRHALSYEMIIEAVGSTQILHFVGFCPTKGDDRNARSFIEFAIRAMVFFLRALERRV